MDFFKVGLLYFSASHAFNHFPLQQTLSLIPDTLHPQTLTEMSLDAPFPYLQTGTSEVPNYFSLLN